MKRIDALRVLAERSAPTDLFVGSVGPLRDDWWNTRPGRKAALHNTFSPAILGSVTATALGLALALPSARVVALDTDGSVLMNLGVFGTLAQERPGNLTVVVLDNEVYESVGGLPTLTATTVDLAGVAASCGCRSAVTVRDTDGLGVAFASALAGDAPGVVVAKIEVGIQQWAADERRPHDGIEDKYRFRRHVADSRASSS